MSCDDDDGYDLYKDYKACERIYGTTNFEGKTYANLPPEGFCVSIGLRKFMIDETGKTYVLIHKSIETENDGADWFIHTPVELITIEEYIKREV